MTSATVNSWIDAPPLPVDTVQNQGLLRQTQFADTKAGTLLALKARGWRWSRFGGCWWVRASDDARAFAAAVLARSRPQSMSRATRVRAGSALARRASGGGAGAAYLMHGLCLRLTGGPLCLVIRRF
jgi:hypothetical protein